MLQYVIQPRYSFIFLLHLLGNILFLSNFAVEMQIEHTHEKHTLHIIIFVILHDKLRTVVQTLYCRPRTVKQSD